MTVNGPAVQAQPAGRGVVRRRRLPREALVGMAFAAPAALLLLIFMVWPAVTAVEGSFRDSSFLGDVGEWAGFDNYLAIFQSSRPAQVGWTSALWTASSLIGQIVLGLAAAVALERVRYAAALRGILLLPYAVPAVTLALMWRWMFADGTGVLTTGLQSLSLVPPGSTPLSSADAALWTVVAANIWHGFPFAMLIYWASLKQIDPTYYEAARLDGAGEWRAFWSITLPLLRNATITLLVLRGIWTATSFDLIWLTTGGGPAGSTYTWPIWIFEEAVGFFRPGRASALAIVLGLALVVILAIFWPHVRRVFRVETGEDR